jgi:hypothetical protein
MSENKVVAAILATSLAVKGKYDDVIGAVATYGSVLKELKGPDAAQAEPPAPATSPRPKDAHPLRRLPWRLLGAACSCPNAGRTSVAMDLGSLLSAIVSTAHA